MFPFHPPQKNNSPETDRKIAILIACLLGAAGLIYVIASYVTFGHL